MRFAGLCSASARVALACRSAARAQGGAPLDVFDPTPRNVFVQVEGSSSPGTVGQTLGGFSRDVSASAATPAPSRSRRRPTRRCARRFVARAGLLHALIVIRDRTSRASLQATAARWRPATFISGPLVFAFSPQLLGTTATAGYTATDLPPLFCTSQAEVDQCLSCSWPRSAADLHPVPGHEVDPPATGEINLVGRETQQGCDGGMCQGPFNVYYTGRPAADGARGDKSRRCRLLAPAALRPARRERLEGSRCDALSSACFLLCCWPVPECRARQGHTVSTLRIRLRAIIRRVRNSSNLGVVGQCSGALPRDLVGDRQHRNRRALGGDSRGVLCTFAWPRRSQRVHSLSDPHRSHHSRSDQPPSHGCLGQRLDIASVGLPRAATRTGDGRLHRTEHRAALLHARQQQAEDLCHVLPFRRPVY